jgi:hypothetical protein
MGWVSDLLLESPVPPPRWLPDSSSRRAQARDIIRRMFEGQGRHLAWHSGHVMHDSAPGLYGYGMSRYVSGDEIEDAVENELTHLNPPIVQGWSMFFVVAAGIATLLILRGAFASTRGSDLGLGFEWLAAIAIGWFLIRLVIGWNERELELCDHGVAIRRWTEIWFHRPGQVLGFPPTLIAAINRDGLVLSGPDGSAVVPLRFWPPTARAAIHDELDGWEVSFGHRPDSHGHPHRRKNHRRDEE